MFKDYKKVFAVYLLIMVVSVVWVVGYERPDNSKQVNNNSGKQVVINYEK